MKDLSDDELKLIHASLLLFGGMIRQSKTREEPKQINRTKRLTSLSEKVKNELATRGISVS